MTTDRDITYLRARYSLSVLPDDPDVDDPYFIFIVNEFGIGQGWRFGTEMPSMPFLSPASSSASLTGPTNFHGCPHGLAMASSYEELLTKSCTVKFGFPHLWMVFPRRCNLPRWTRTSSSAERFPMPPSTHVIWRNSVRYSSTHCLLMSIRPFLSVSSTHSNYSSPIVLSSP